MFRILFNFAIKIDSFLSVGLSLLLLVGISSCQGRSFLVQDTGQVVLTLSETFQQPSAIISATVTDQLLPASTVPPVGTFTPAPANLTRGYFTPTAGTISSPMVSSSFSVCSPLKDHNLMDLEEIITFPYDPPPLGEDSGHHGVDFAYYRRGERLSIQGVPVQSVLAGRVAAVNENLIPYGNMVIIETQYEHLPPSLIEFFNIPAWQSLYLLYAHMQDTQLPALGENVACGQTIGAVGNTPENWSSAPHLHFEARYGPAGIDLSGMCFYDTHAQVEQMEKYIRWRTSGEFMPLDPMALLNFGLPSTIEQGG